jgi:mitochondrial fission protein ELM1
MIGDGKPGHENQSRGLAEALARQRRCDLHLLTALPRARALAAWIFGRAAWTATLPAPDLIIGAGHATHLSLLAARRAHGGRCVVLMKPSLPCRFFDYCVIPQHDKLAPSARVFLSVGALNRMRANPAAVAGRASKGLMLIGGPSRHFVWDNATLALQIDSILAHTPGIAWTLATSRRTPSDFGEHLSRHAQLSIVPHGETDAAWLPAQLASHGVAWVTPDSASMVYEALSADAQVGLFDLSANPVSRVAHAMAQLADAHQITRFVSWCAHNRFHPKPPMLAEADRCATWLLQQLDHA